MFWKDWQGWLRGAVIGLLISVFLTIFLLFLRSVSSGAEGAWVFVFFIIAAFPAAIVMMLFDQYGAGFGLTMTILFTFLFYTGLMTLLGHLYGKGRKILSWIIGSLVIAFPIIIALVMMVFGAIENALGR